MSTKIKVRRRISRVGLVFAAPYCLFVGYMIAHMLIKPDPGAGEWFFIYFASIPVSWLVVEIAALPWGMLRLPEGFEFLFFILGSLGFYYYIGKFVGILFAKKEEPNQALQPTAPSRRG